MYFPTGIFKTQTSEEIDICSLRHEQKGNPYILTRSTDSFLMPSRPLVAFSSGLMAVTGPRPPPLYAAAGDQRFSDREDTKWKEGRYRNRSIEGKIKGGVSNRQPSSAPPVTRSSCKGKHTLPLPLLHHKLFSASLKPRRAAHAKSGSSILDSQTKHVTLRQLADLKTQGSAGTGPVIFSAENPPSPLLSPNSHLQ